MAREAVVGTVHKPQQPPIPEPEGWAFMYRPIDSEGTWPWRFGMTELRGRKWAENRALDFARDNELVRLVHIGPAPKVPVEAIRAVVACAVEWRHLEEMANRQTPYAQRCVNEVQRWLSAQEEGDK